MFPHLREIDEEHEAKVYRMRHNLDSGSPLPPRGSFFFADSDSDNTNEKAKFLSHISFRDDDDPPRESDRVSANYTWEVRDEANRPWWKFFDEYEYRRNIQPISFLHAFHWFSRKKKDDERKLVSKIDLLLCLYAFIMHWLKYIEEVNVTNAYVSGMKEDLNMHGNDLVYTQAVYTVSSVVFQIPFIYFASAIPCHYLLPLMDLGWGVATLGTSQVRTVRQLQVCRFFVGAFESGFFPTINFLLSFWYKPNQFVRRAGFFYTGQMLGVLTAGLIQAGVLDTFAGVGGLAGWRWMFIIDFIIAIPVAVIGFFVIPGTPNRCYSLFLTDQEIFIARERNGRNNSTIKELVDSYLDKKMLKSLFTQWPFYLFVLVSAFSYNASNVYSGSYLLWLKSLNIYSATRINQLSTITPTLGILYIWIVSVICDYGHSRFWAVIFTQVLNLLGNLLLVVWSMPTGGFWFAYALQYPSWAVIIALYSWAVDTLSNNARHRIITVIFMTTFAQATAALTSPFTWKTSDAPRYLVGYSYAVATSIVTILLAVVILIFYKKRERQRAFSNHILLYNSANGDITPIPPSPIVSGADQSTIGEEEGGVEGEEEERYDD